jgi:hypothetical protein
MRNSGCACNSVALFVEVGGGGGGGGGGRQLGCVAHHSPPSSSKFENECSCTCTLTPVYYFIACTGIAFFVSVLVLVLSYLVQVIASKLWDDFY